MRPARSRGIGCAVGILCIGAQIFTLALGGCAGQPGATELIKCPCVEVPEDHLGGVVQYVGGAVVDRQRVADGDTTTYSMFLSRWPDEADSFYVIARVASHVSKPDVQQFALSREADAIASQARYLTWKWYWDYESRDGVVIKDRSGVRRTTYSVDGWLVLRSDVSDCELERPRTPAAPAN